MLFLDMIGIGATWASVNSIPFAMIANVISEKKLGIYMGLFNITVCLPQIITSLGAGYVLKVWLHGNVVLLMFLSGFLLLLGAFLTVFISEGVKT